MVDDNASPITSIDAINWRYWRTQKAIAELLSHPLSQDRLRLVLINMTFVSFGFLKNPFNFSSLYT